jgi:hypothetical protein
MLVDELAPRRLSAHAIAAFVHECHPTLVWDVSNVIASYAWESQTFTLIERWQRDALFAASILYASDCASDCASDRASLLADPLASPGIDRSALPPVECAAFPGAAASATIPLPALASQGPAPVAAAENGPAAASAETKRALCERTGAIWSAPAAHLLAMCADGADRARVSAFEVTSGHGCPSFLSRLTIPLLSAPNFRDAVRDLLLDPRPCRLSRFVTVSHHTPPDVPPDVPRDTLGVRLFVATSRSIWVAWIAHREVAPLGTIMTVACPSGDPLRPGPAVDGPLSSASFDEPLLGPLSADGNKLFVGDSGHHRVRCLLLDGWRDGWRVKNIAGTGDAPADGDPTSHHALLHPWLSPRILFFDPVPGAPPAPSPSGASQSSGAAGTHTSSRGGGSHTPPLVVDAPAAARDAGAGKTSIASLVADKVGPAEDVLVGLCAGSLRRVTLATSRISASPIWNGETRGFEYAHRADNFQVRTRILDAGMVRANPSSRGTELVGEWESAIVTPSGIVLAAEGKSRSIYAIDLRTHVATRIAGGSGHGAQPVDGPSAHGCSFERPTRLAVARPALGVWAEHTLLVQDATLVRGVTLDPSLFRADRAAAAQSSP